MIVRFYDNMWDNEGMEADLSIPDLIAILAEESTKRGDRADKENTRALGTARYPNGITRSKAGALDASAIALDIDDGWTLDEAYEACDALDTPHVIYTTTKHTEADHRFRIILFLNRPVVGWEEYQALWYSLARRFGAKMDAKTRDISRISIVPRSWDGDANVFHWCTQGILLDVDAMLKRYGREPEPERSLMSAEPTYAEYLAQARRNLMRLRNEDVDPIVLTDLDNSPIISQSVLDDCLSSSRGGRTYRLLCSVASLAKLKGYTIGLNELVAISKAFSRRAGRKKISEFEHRNDSTNALNWVARQN